MMKNSIKCTIADILMDIHYTLYGMCLFKNRYNGNSKSMGLFKKVFT